MKLTKALKHFLIPHEHNKYAPHLFRELSMGLIILFIAFLLGASFGSSFVLKKTVLGANVTADVLVDLTNETRLANNDAPLSRNNLLDEAATLKGDDMSTYQYFSHNSPTGITPWHWFQQVGYNFLYAGENLAINFIDATEVRDAWMASPTHRANLLDTRFKEIGMATISGIYQNEPTIYIVQLFGTPAKASAPPQVQAQPQATEQKPVNAPVATSSALGEVKGESKVNGTTTTSASSSPIRTIVNTNTVAIAVNTEAATSSAPVVSEEPKIYAPWYERLLFAGTYYVDMILKGLFIAIFVGLVILLAVELKRQHWKHAVYGLSVLVILLLAIMLNQMFW